MASSPPPSRVRPLAPARAARKGAAPLALVVLGLALAAFTPAQSGSGSAPQPARPERPEAVVLALYRALDGKAAPEAAPVEWTDPQTARRLFTPGLANLAIADGKRAVPDRRIPFDPFSGPLQTRPQVSSVRLMQQKDGRADVVTRFRSNGAPQITYRLRQDENGQWRIADIWWGADRSRTLAGLLR